MEIKINPLFKVHNDMDGQLSKLSAWIQTLGFVLQGLDKEGTRGGKSEAHAIAFIDRYPAYSEMLFLALSGLQDCKDALEKLSVREYEMIKATE